MSDLNTQKEQELKEFIANEYLQLDTYKTQLDEKEKFMEEQRLALDHFTEAKVAEEKAEERKEGDKGSNITIINAPHQPAPIKPILPIIE